MVAKKELTDEHIRKLRQMAADGMKKSQAVNALGVDINWLNRSAHRTGFKPELDQLFGVRTQRKHVITDAEMDQLRVLAGNGLSAKEACKKIGSTPETIKAAAERAERLGDYTALFPPRRKSERSEALPRDLCTAVKWLKRDWRIAA